MEEGAKSFETQIPRMDGCVPLGFLECGKLFAIGRRASQAPA